MVLVRVIGVRTYQFAAAGQAMGKQREILHRRAEDRTGGRAIQAVVLSVRMSDEVDLATEILIEVVGTAADRTQIDRAVVDTQGFSWP